MSVVRYRPFTLTRAFGPEFDRLFDVFADDRAWAPRADVFEQEGHLVARFEVPGFSADDLEVTLEDGVLTLSGKRTFESAEGTVVHRQELAEGAFRRSIRIGDAYDAEQVEATYKDGILEVTLVKRPEVLPRKIEISTAG